MTAITASRWLEQIHALPLRDSVRIMNVCGGHERAISNAGLRGALPPGIELTVVMDQRDYIDMMIDELENNILAGLLLVLGVFAALVWGLKRSRALNLAGSAQLEVLAATAEIALGQEDLARGSLERALRAEPDLRLDPTLHSPKLVRLFDHVRAGHGLRLPGHGGNGDRGDRLHGD